MAHHSKWEDPLMVKIQKNLSHEEAVEVLDHVISLILVANNEELRKEFQRASRATQSGYDVTMYLLNKGLLKLGKFDPQEKIKV